MAKCKGAVRKRTFERTKYIIRKILVYDLQNNIPSKVVRAHCSRVDHNPNFNNRIIYTVSYTV